MIEHWRKKLAEKDKEFFVSKEYNGGRRRLESGERPREHHRLLNHEERE